MSLDNQWTNKVHLMHLTDLQGIRGVRNALPLQASGIDALTLSTYYQ